MCMIQSALFWPAFLLQAATRKGTAKSWDHCQIVHGIWAQAAANHTHIWIERVGSEYNISDLPSRERYGLLKELGAVWRAPVITELFMKGAPTSLQ